MFLCQQGPNAKAAITSHLTDVVPRLQRGQHLAQNVLDNIRIAGVARTQPGRDHQEAGGFFFSVCRRKWGCRLPPSDFYEGAVAAQFHSSSAPFHRIA